jgi:hypothetical protein
MAQPPLVLASALVLALVLALGLVLVLVHLSPQDLAPPLVLGLVRVWVLGLAAAWVQASA